MATLKSKHKGYKYGVLKNSSAHYIEICQKLWRRYKTVGPSRHKSL